MKGKRAVGHAGVNLVQSIIAMEAIGALTALAWRGVIDGGTVVTAILAVTGVVGGTTVAVHATASQAETAAVVAQETGGQHE